MVLGVISSKTPVLESLDALKRRVDEAARYIDLDRLAIGPQCGFASTVAGNPVTEDDERRKLCAGCRSGTPILALNIACISGLFVHRTLAVFADSLTQKFPLIYSSARPRPAMSADKLDKEYDFIVVGSGAGGGPVAVRLAEAGYSVLILEAGGAEEPYDYKVPAFHALSSENNQLAWKFYVHHYADPEQEKRDTEKLPASGTTRPESSIRARARWVAAPHITR